MLDWARPYPGWVYVILPLAFLALIVLARRLAISPRLRSWSILLPRMGVFALLLLVLLNPVHRHDLQLPSEPASAVLLVDCSQSMALDEPQSRLEQVKQTIHSVDAALSGPQRPRIQLYRFGNRLAAAPDLNSLQPTDDTSELGEALERLPGRFSSGLPKAVVVFSDGAVPESLSVANLKATYRRLGVPLHVYPVGNATVRGDIAIQDLVVPRRAEVGAKVKLQTVIRSRGFDGERTLVQVLSAGNPQAPPLVQLPITLTQGEQPVELVLEANSDTSDLVLNVPLKPGEAVERNNRVPFQLAVGNRKIKVLYMEGTGGNEYHWVQDALTEDKDIQCESLVADQQYVQRPRLMRIRDPYKGFPATRAELFEYDCVICSDISRGAFTQEQLDWTVELVAQRGGGFAMVGGITSFGAGYWDQSAWDKLIPVDMAGGNLGRGWLYHTFQINIPPDAEAHPIWRILPDPQQNRDAIALMPPFFGTNYIQRLKPAATSLAVSRQPIPNVGTMTVMAAENYGRGRTFALSPDTTADWGRDFESRWGINDNRYFRKFWRNVVRWLSENSAGSNRRLQADTDRVIYRPGQPIQVTARAFDELMNETIEYQLSAKLVAVSDAAANPSTSTAATPLLPVAGTKNYAGELSLSALPGQVTTTSVGLIPWNLEVAASHQGKEIGKTVLQVQLLNDSRELLAPAAVPERLEPLATDPGCQVLRNTRELQALLRDLPSRPGDVVVTRTPRWDKPWIWLLIIGLLGIEWSLRRRSGFA